ETSLSFAELDEVLIGRRAMGESGRQVLNHLLDTKLLARLAVESKLVVTAGEIDARCKEVEAEIVASGAAKSLKEYLESSGVPMDVFRDTLKLAMIHETLARRALDTPAGEKLNGEKQEMWLAQVKEQRGAQLPPPPWPDGIVARCGDLEVKVVDLLDLLRVMLPADDLREDCYQLLLLKRIRARMPDLAPEAQAKAVDAEIERRKREFESQPRNRGLKYEQAMGAQGLQAAYLRQDPAVQIAALATLWVDRSQGDNGLRETYTKEREYFDGHYGEAVDSRMIFLNATTLPNQLLPRDFQAAERQLEGWKSDIKTVDDFGKLAREHSEEKNTREKDGRLGYIARGDERLPAEIREALFTAKPGADGTAVVGPVRIQGGVCLLWVGLRRPAPGWEEMAANVHRELRKRFLEGLLARESMRTYLDKN
ncbi:MAG TPA: peptidylprolyl isomerase, partial [Planctomycetota bacterium]|nr:peptidylprolyl isomerase [Planctomycetota bacterium]